MNRPYDTAFFQERVAALRTAVPDVAITTDLIVGYPGETGREHENTLRFAERIGFQRTHVFRYSPRPRTHAEMLADDVPDDEKKRRHAELQAVVDRTDRAFSARYIDQTLPVLVEGGQGTHNTLSGHTPNYINVRFAGPQRALRGQIVPVRLTSVLPGGDATGELALSEADLAARLAEAARPSPADFVPLPMAAA
jgi:tRNA A37 methylthiotransferase MiaB